MNIGKKTAGVLIIIASIAVIVAWEKWGKEYVTGDSILVFRENVAEGTVITEDMLKEVKMPVSENCVRKQEEELLLGKEAVQFIHKGVPIFKDYVGSSRLTANADKDRYIMPIPWDWLMAGTLRVERGDKIHFYMNKNFITTASVASADYEAKVYEVVVSSEQAESLSAMAAGGGKFTITYD